MTEAELKKGGVYVWRKGDPDHECVLRVTLAAKINRARDQGLEAL